MTRIIYLLSFILLIDISTTAFAQNLDGRPYIFGRDPNIDLFMASWKESEPVITHGSLVERDILTQGDPINPPVKGAILKYTKRFTYAILDAGTSTEPTELQGEQEIFFILSGKGVIKAGKKNSELYSGICILMPANLEFTMTNTGSDPLTMYLINEPIPAGFRTNKDMLVKDENITPISSTNGHWIHIVKGLFSTADGLGTLQSVITVSFDPMTIGHPHSHVEGCEEVWAAVTGTSIAFLGKQIRWQPPGTAYMIPPDGNTPHSNINTSNKEQIKMFYFARYRDHETRK